MKRGRPFHHSLILLYMHLKLAVQGLEASVLSVMHVIAQRERVVCAHIAAHGRAVVKGLKQVVPCSPQGGILLLHRQ